MSSAELLRTIVARLEAADVAFMLTGSLAAAVHGAGRATMDIDLVIDATAEQLRSLVRSLSVPDYYVSEEAALEALAAEGMFNVVAVATGWKADLIIRKSREFSITEFRRRQFLDFDGIALWVATREDVILAKLEWAKRGGSSRQLEDVANLLRIGAAELDHAYLDHWLDELQLRSEWRVASQMRQAE